jgi:hypothetical protein
VLQRCKLLRWCLLRSIQCTGGPSTRAGASGDPGHALTREAVGMELAMAPQTDAGAPVVATAPAQMPGTARQAVPADRAAAATDASASQVRLRSADHADLAVPRAPWLLTTCANDHH